jgi:hypothetical protein
MPPPAILHALDYKTTNTTIVADKIATHEGANRRPPDMNLVGSKDMRDDLATYPPAPPVEVALRWRRSRGKLF